MKEEKYIIEKETDWTAYYSKPKSKFSTFTQQFTLKKILKYIEKYAHSSVKIMELGGGNSCFAIPLVKLCKIPVKNYSIVDSCEVAVTKFQDMKIAGEAYLEDLTSEGVIEKINSRFDVVYSIGLIEHFRGKDIEQIIKTHFSLCEEKGMVLISFPTPTMQYRITRKLMEKLGVWGFPDEKPLRYKDVEGIIRKHGVIVEKTINYKLPLTQMVIVAIKEGTEKI